MIFGYVYLLLHQDSPLSDALFLKLLSIPFNDSVDWRLAIAEKGQQILGDNLLGLQVGNEPAFPLTVTEKYFLQPSMSFLYYTIILV